MFTERSRSYRPSRSTGNYQRGRNSGQYFSGNRFSNGFNHRGNYQRGNFDQDPPRNRFSDGFTPRGTFTRKRNENDDNFMPNKKPYPFQKKNHYKKLEEQTISALLNNLFDMPKKFLNLSGFIKYVEEKMQQSQSQTISAKQLGWNFHYVPFAHDIFSVIQKKFPEVEVIDFSENNIKKLNGFDILTTEQFPKLTALSFARNLIEDSRQFESLSNLTNLSDLNLLENPISENRDHIQQIQRIFPNLKFFNMEEIGNSQPISFDTISLTDSSMISNEEPISIKEEFSYIEPIKDLVLNFAQNFDQNRENLKIKYQDNSAFSLQTSQEMKQTLDPNFQNNEWLNYHHNIISKDASNSILIKGTDIQKMFQIIPKTSTEIDIQNIKHYIIKSNSNEMVIVKFNGVFQFVGLNVKLFFTRIFTLVPNNGNEVILNDQLILIKTV
ncbi:nuclear RNA export factor 1-related [Anaeramoeba ignava]|uniref:Nuclear RNA export factor 1-related n=1 Tax=Anaeramoeba ignava TaxID=1746090 RepID=A0A9Q0LFA5_ANAIG|nr:nuclear RNA export factor 1-related [Anaeramoeba ignava]